MKQLLRVHNGGALLDSEQWTGAHGDEGRGLVEISTQLQQQSFPDLRFYGLLGTEPGPRALAIAGASQTNILYDMDTEPGRLLYLDVLSGPAVIPLCRSISTLIECHIALARAGFVTLQPLGPSVIGPKDEVRDIHRAHHVAYVGHGTEDWLSCPGSAHFTID